MSDDVEESPSAREPVTLFEVSDGGTLRMANYVEARTRAEFYDYVAAFRSRSPEDLVEAMEDCEPLAWAVYSLYSDFRDDLEANLEEAQGAADGDEEDEIASLESRLDALPEEPEEGAADWVRTLTVAEFTTRVCPVIAEWFREGPDWHYEDDYLPASGTAQGAALEFFRDMDSDSLEILGIHIVEGDRPGSTYYAAELPDDIEKANHTAAAHGIPVRFVAAKT
ncbi:MAG: hypothetical protein EA424_17800 [Planctomycetaceae bacterium]|nr:MAG: hypothetical protein EA424_17800 [Planctomycetaceae bacterium]